MKPLMTQFGLFSLIPDYPWIDQWMDTFPGGGTRPRRIERIEYRSGFIVLYGRHQTPSDSWYHETFRLDGEWLGRSFGKTAEGNDVEVRVLYRARKKAV